MKTWLSLTFIAIFSGGFVGACHQREATHVTRKDSPKGGAEAARLVEHADIDNAETLVRMRLRDPSGATFMDEKLVHVRGQEVVCGVVNAKSGSRGMSGHEHFAVVGTTVMLGSDGGDALRRIKEACGA